MSKGRMILFGGMGYPITESPWGMPQFKTRLEAIGLEVLLTTWDARQAAYDFGHGYPGWLGYGGDSLGAGSSGEYPGDLKRDVNYAVGFQPSDDDARTVKMANGKLVQVIAPNILRAHCVFDPDWIDTVGLGQTQWIKTVGSKTTLLTTQHRAAHPDDTGPTQDMAFDEIQRLVDSQTVPVS